MYRVPGDGDVDGADAGGNPGGGGDCACHLGQIGQQVPQLALVKTLQLGSHCGHLWEKWKKGVW